MRQILHESPNNHQGVVEIAFGTLLGHSLARCVAREDLVAEVAVLGVVALLDVGAVFGGVEVGYAGGDAGGDDGGLEFHGKVAEEGYHCVET